MKNKFLQFLIFIAAFLFASPFVLNAQNNQVFTLTADNLANGKTAELNEAGWKYHAGDDGVWANSNFDDAGWETLKNSAMTKDSLPQTGWNGSGWLRLRLNVAPALVNVPLNLEAAHLGASEIYLDGKLIKRYGSIGNTAATEVPYNPNAEPFAIVFDSAGEHLLAVRYSNQAAADFNSGYGKWLLGRETSRYANIGFQSRLRHFDDTVNQGWKVNYDFTYIIIQAAILFSFGVLHLLLFALYPQQRGNLFYSLFLFGVAVNDLCLGLLPIIHYGTVGTYRLEVLNNFSIQTQFFLLAFLYTNFYQRIPRYFWIFVAACVLAVLAITFFRSTSELLLSNLIGIAVGIEAARIMARAIRRRMPDAWIVGIGILLFDLAFLREFVISQIVRLPVSVNTIIDIFSSYGFILALTIYLARQFARTSTNLDAQLVKQVEHERDKARFMIVEAENERRAKELEEARQLQLSMLPKKLPVIPNLEIAAYMKPATEVGGDYYDFHVGKDGTLTVAVGDATGHGLKAGTVVTATKSLFNNLADAPDIPDTLRQISRALKAMNLRGLFMAMTLIKLKDNSLSICAAGMPSTLVYRAANKTVEEISIRALPLGSMTNFNYRGQELVLQTGDCVVVMSDGFPEMFNAENEMLGFDKAAEVLKEIAAHTPQEIIDRLNEVSGKWAGARPADDDVTFVVLKIV